MAQNIPSYVPKDGLVGWWPFNGNANDESGNKNHGTVNGATLTPDRNGNKNSAYAFNGINTQITLPFNNSQLSNNYVISAWIKLDSFTSEYPAILYGYSTETGKYTIRFELDKADKDMNFYMEIESGNPGVVLQTKLNSIDTNKYYHLLINKNENNTSVYINSQLNNISIGINPNNFSNLIYLGANSIQQGFKGIIDDIAIYNRALSDQEVKQLYQGCPKETATSSNFKSVIYTTNNPVTLSATPSGGTFNGEAVTNNAFNPSKAKLGKNHVKYTFKNSTGCADSTNFEMILVDTLGNKCSTYDTLKIKVQLTTGIKAGQIATMNVYPNPTSDVVIIEASDVAALNGYSYKMVDLQGKQVYKELVTKSKTEISLKSIGTKGVYILHILDEKGVSIENKKIVLE